MKRRPFGISRKKRASASDSCIATSRANRPSSSRSTTNCLSEYARQAAEMPPGKMARPLHLRLEHEPRCAQAASKWRSGRSLRFWLAIPKRAFFPRARRSPVSASSRCSSKRSSESSDAPKQPLAAALGRLLYLVHLAVLLWWLLDKSSNQRATAALVSLTQQLLPSAALTLRVPPVRRFVISVDELVREALFGSPVSA